MRFKRIKEMLQMMHRELAGSGVMLSGKKTFEK